MNTATRRSRWSWAALLPLVLAANGCGGGGGGDSSPNIPPPPSPPPAVVNTAAYERYVAQHGLGLRSLSDSSDFSDLAALNLPLADRRIVLLGESTHGAAEMNLIKVRLIKYLHQHHGFDVLVFEAGLSSCTRGLERQAGITAQSLMLSCTHGVWWTHEVLELFRYVLATQGSARPLRLAGMDVQFSGDGENGPMLRRWFDDQLAGTPEPPGLPPTATWHAAVDRVYELDGPTGRCWSGDDASCTQLRAGIGEPRAVLQALADALQPADDAEPARWLPALQARNLVRALHHMAEVADGYRGSHGQRDRGMADNLSDLARQVFPNQRMVVWAHNAHTVTDHYGDDARSRDDRSTGMHLATDWGDELYSIGLFMLGGVSARTDRGSLEAVGVTPHRADSLEALASTSPHDRLFLPFTRTDEPGEEDDWLHRRTEVKHWGAWSMHLWPSRSFDAVITLRQTSLPSYVNWW